MAEDKNLREAGLKVTLPRIRILEIFEESETFVIVISDQSLHLQDF